MADRVYARLAHLAAPVGDLIGHRLAPRLWGPVIGPVISLLSFVCSIGNVPLAAVLWNGGISFRMRTTSTS